MLNALKYLKRQASTTQPGSDWGALAKHTQVMR